MRCRRWLLATVFGLGASFGCGGFGCGGFEPSQLPDDSGPGDEPGPDGGSDAGPDGSSKLCAIPSILNEGSLTYLGALVSDGIQLQAPLNGDVAPDFAIMRFRDGVLPFSAGFGSGVFNISGNQGDANLCGACALLLGDVVDNQTTQTFVAESGSIEIDEISSEFGGMVVGRVVGAVYREVTIVGDEQLEVEGGCEVSGDIEFSATIQ